MAKCRGVFLILFLALVISSVSPCEISLYPDSAESTTRTFMKHTGQNDITVVFMNLHIEKESEKGAFDLLKIRGNDSFLPWRWAWASSEGAFILKMPLDYPLLSLGVLTTTTTEMDVYLQANPVGCTPDQEDWTHQVAQILIGNVTTGVGYDASGFGQDGGGVFRSAYLDSHVTGVRGLIGYKCCVWSKETDQWTCDVDHSSGWMVTWFGPLIVVGWMYVILITKCVAEFHLLRAKTTASAGKIVEQLKVYVMAEASGMSSRILMVNSPSELLSRYDKIGVMDVLDISRKTQMKLVQVTRITVLVILCLGYYGYVAGSVVFYRGKEFVISEMASAEEVALNVFGHIGWIYANENVGIKYYAMVELGLTCLIPLMLLIIYVSQRTQYQQKSPSQVHPKQAQTQVPQSTTTKLPPIVTPTKAELAETVQRVTHERRTKAGRCLHSSPGRVLTTTCTVVVLLYTVAIVCPHLAYMAYFLLKGALLSMTILATWLLPAGVMLQYLLSVFAPLRSLYTYARESFFTHIETDAAAGNCPLAICHEDVLFIPRVLVENFYHRYARRRLFNCVLRAMVAFAVLIILFLVLYSSGSQALQDNGSSILGVNLVLLLPLLGRTMGNSDLEEVEKRSLDRAVREDIAERSRLRNQWKKVKDLSLQKKSTSMKSAAENIKKDCLEDEPEGH